MEFLGHHFCNVLKSHLSYNGVFQAINSWGKTPIPVGRGVGEEGREEIVVLPLVFFGLGYRTGPLCAKGKGGFFGLFGWFF